MLAVMIQVFSFWYFQRLAVLAVIFQVFMLVLIFLGFLAVLTDIDFSGVYLC